jgi:hypothetical protein
MIAAFGVAAALFYVLAPEMISIFKVARTGR